MGRESTGMTAARANAVRSDRARGKEQTNKGKREAFEAVKKAEEERPTIARLFDLYDAAVSRKSLHKERLVYLKHIAPIFADKIPDELVTLDIDRLRLSKLKTLRPQTVRQIIGMLSRAINYGVKKGYCPQPNPSRLHFEYPNVHNIKTENLSHDEMTRFIQALDAEPDQNAAGIIRLALTTGMRKGAILALRWDDVDFERGFITLQGRSAKNKKTERIPLSSATRAVLESVERTDSPFVFPGPGGEERKSFVLMPRRVRDRAGLPKDFRPLHGLRHTFASWLASSGAVDLYTLQKLLTHSSPQMTQRYAHLADEALQRAAAVAGDIFQGVSGTGPEAVKVLPFKKAQG
ncbi:MAG: site-specific integrase [Desulfovibrio sp.]|nr:site-specific integrase [Desulfovibrio sp.]